MDDAKMGAGEEPAPFRFALVPAHKPEQLLDNVRYAMTLGLPEVKWCEPHDEIMSIAGGGPSLEDTWPELTGYVAAANGSLGYLLGKGVVPQMCGVCDPSEHMVDIIEAREGVGYFLASCVHPKVFDKLLKANCKVYLWHLHPIDGLDDLLKEYYPDGWVQIPGGCTMGTRWLTLGYHLGFRKFHVHGLDSSFRDKSSHAYPDHQDTKEWITFDGFKTRINFLGQVTDFIGLLEDAMGPHVDPIGIKMFGDGLLQKRYAHWLSQNPGRGFKWPAGDTEGQKFIPWEALNIQRFLDLVPGNFKTVVQAGGNVGIYPAYLARRFRDIHTFEPDPENYACMVENLKGKRSITTYNAALGDKSGKVGTKQKLPQHVGTMYVVEDGDIPMQTIDSLELEECNLIWLDIEGYEEKALMGAEKTIERHRPAVIIEEKGNAALHGLSPSGASDWLMARGYKPEARFGNDVLYLC